MADALENQLRDPNADLASFMDRIIEIVNTEWQNPYDKKFSRFLKYLSNALARCNSDAACVIFRRRMYSANATPKT